MSHIYATIKRYAQEDFRMMELFRYEIPGKQRALKNPHV